MPCANCMGGVVTCAFGMAPSPITILPVKMIMGPSGPIANIVDSKPMINIKPFGMCMTPSNPMVAAATAAALGVLTPQPCIPVTVAPWIAGSPKTLLKGTPMLTQTSIAMCMWGGVINTIMPGQMKVIAS